MVDRISKGMILAAGLGTRLRPITNKMPKPLIEVGDKKIIEYNLNLLSKNGVKEVVINLHYLGEQISSFLGDGSRYGLKIKYSDEPVILGTGGGIKNVQAFFGKSPFVVLNGDVLIDIDLQKLFSFHLSKNFSVTLVLRPLAAGETYTPVSVKADLVTGFGSGKMMYTGVQVLGPGIFDILPEGRFSDIVAEAYLPMIARGDSLGAFVFDGFWTDIGTLERLEEVRTQIKNSKLKFKNL